MISALYLTQYLLKLENESMRKPRRPSWGAAQADAEGRRLYEFLLS
jgi:hypothetical protein